MFFSEVSSLLSIKGLSNPLYLTPHFQDGQVVFAVLLPVSAASERGKTPNHMRALQRSPSFDDII